MAGIDKIPQSNVGVEQIKKTDKINNTKEQLQNEIDARFKLTNLKIELPVTEKEVMQKLVSTGFFKGAEFSQFDTKIHLIKKGVFSVVDKDGNVISFVDDNANILFTPAGVVQSPFVENGKAQKEAGYKEINENGVFNMYHTDINGKIVGEKININSVKYYQAWLDIIFFDDIFNKLARIENNKLTNKNIISLFIEFGSFKIDDLELFLQRGLISKEVFNYGIEELKKILPDQCKDKRLINFKGANGKSMGIKESDLKRYLEKGYIDAKLAQKCFNLLPKEMRDLTKK